MENDILYLVPSAVIDNNYAIVKQSAKFENLLSNKSMLGQNFLDLLIISETEKFKNFCENEIFSDASEFILINNKHVLINLLHRTDYKILILEDVSHLRHRENEYMSINTLLENAFNISSEAVRIIDNEYNIIKENKAFSEITQNTEEEDLMSDICNERMCLNICKTDRCVLKRTHDTTEQISEEVEVNINGVTKYFLLTAKPYIVNNEILGVIENLKDITSIKHATNEIINKNKHIELIINNVPLLVSYINTEYRYIFINSHYSNAFKKSESEIIGRHVSEIHKKDYDVIKIYLDRVAKGEQINYQAEFEVPLYNELRWFDVNYIPDIDSQNKVRGFFVFNNDITDRYNYVKALKDSEEKYRLITENVEDVIWTMDATGHFIYVSPSVEKLRGYTKEELLKQTFKQSITPDFHYLADKTLFKTLKRIAEGEKDIEIQRFFMSQPHKNGSEVKTEILVKTCFEDNGDFKYFLGVTRKLEDTIELYQNDYKNLSNKLDFGFASVNYQNNSFIINDINHRFAQIINKSADNILYKDINNFFNIQHNELSKYKNTEYINKKTVINYNYNNSNKFLEIILFSLQVNRILVIVKDITEYRHKEMEIEQNIEKSKCLNNYLTDVIHIFDNNNNLSYISGGYQKLFGVEQNNLLGKSAYEILTLLKISAEQIENLKKIFFSKLAEPNILKTIVYKLNINNVERYFQTNLQLIYDTNKNISGAAGVTRDITLNKLIENELIVKEELLNYIDKNIKDVIYVLDEKLVYTSLIGDISEIFGYPISVLINKHYTEFLQILQVSENDIENNLTRINFLIENRTDNLQYELKIVRNNQTAFLETKAKIKYNSEGKLLSIIGVIRDITARKYNDLRIKRLSLAVRQSPSSVLITDINGTILFANNKFLEISGFDKEDILGKNPKILKSGLHNNDFYLNLWNTILSGQVWKGELINKRKNGTLFYENAYIFPVKDENGEIAQLMALKEDITDRKQVEIALLEERETLKNTLQYLEEQNIEIEMQKEKLVELNATKDKFLSIIGHDLKNPVGSLYNFANIIEKEFDKLEKMQKLEYIKIIRDVSKATLQLLENLLTWARTQLGKIDFSPRIFDINELNNNILSEFILQAKNKNININVQQKTEIQAFADTNMIATVMRNLISNAIKYTYQNGNIEIAIYLKDDEICYSVSDSGVGMTEDEISKLFKIETHFTNLGTNDEPGTGLGLILCNEFIKKNRGIIIVNSKPGEGTNFTFKIPTVYFE